uniref:Putative ATPase domain containing protein n=1 Tax=viral metagenome TaxID=1070528 RepID=A0A6M3M1U6_9ZZZZ
MPIVALANQKGGVGKTTLTTHLGAWLSRQGQKVIAVDGDPQGNLTSWLLNGDLDDGGMFRLLVVGDPLRRVVRPVGGEWQLGLLPGNFRTGEAMIFLAATRKPFSTVARSVQPLGDMADYVLIDMPPSRSAGFEELLFAADYVLIPTQLERLSLEGVGFMAHAGEDLRREHGRGPRLLGIVPNMARLQTIEHREQLEALVGVYGPTVWPAIPLSVRVTEACSYGQSLFEFAPSEPVTAALAKVAERFLENTRGRR